MNVDEALAFVTDAGVRTVRVLFADQHGVLRGKALAVSSFASVLERGVGVPASLLHKDTGTTYAIGLWAATGNAELDGLVGVQNIVLRPDPGSLRLIPWAADTAVILSDLETLQGAPIELSTRRICADAVDRLASRGHRFVAGLELEFHLYRRAADGSLTDSHPGWDLLGEDPLDRILPILEPIRLGLDALGFPPATIEAELGPSQIEMTFAPASGLSLADQALFVRSAIRQIARHNELHATFMSRPRLISESFPSGWHLHQSLVSASAVADIGPSQFTPINADDLLSPIGRQWVAGLLHN
ncbi:MAG: glutamine synthetase, partial [Actinomycetota bacterium]|nr:glutamine synthetase [Actinomycetota bacterium]